MTEDYLKSQGLSKTFPQRFLEKVRVEPSGCWIWTGFRMSCRGKKTYGTICTGRKGEIILAHRASWIIHKGPIPDGMDVLHNCSPSPNNQACVNPEHLHLGNDSMNFKESYQNGEHEPHRGEKCGTHKLTQSQVLEIRGRHRFRGGRNSGRSLAKEFGVTEACISAIMHNKNWFWL